MNEWARWMWSSQILCLNDIVKKTRLSETKCLMSWHVIDHGQHVTSLLNDLRQRDSQPFFNNRNRSGTDPGFPRREGSWGDVRQPIITVRKRSCGKVMFSQACVKNSVHREGGSVPPTGQTDRHPLLGRHPLGRQGDNPLSRHPPAGRHHPWADTPLLDRQTPHSLGRHPYPNQTATTANFMHPT